MPKKIVLASIGALLFAATAMLAIGYPSLATPLLLVLLTGVSFAILSLLWVRSSKQTQLLRSIRSEIAANHKRASVWDWKLNERLDRSGLASHDGTVSDTRTGRRHAWKDHPAAPSLLATGAFSADFYRAASGKFFERAIDAASHYLSLGMPSLLAPNALVDPDAFPEAVVKAMRAGDAIPLISHLMSGDSQQFGPAFDPKYVDSDPAMEVGPLGQFLAGLSDQTPLPVGDDAPLSGVSALDYIAAITTLASDLRAERGLRAVRTRKSWDLRAESEWKEALPPLPNDQQPLVSVVMPVWNRAELVGHAIASIQQQTYSHWELCVVDDHSSDDSVAVLKDLAAKDPRIRVLQNPRKGVSSARNTGLEAARGEYLAFLDSDNQWRPDFLECMVKAAERDHLDWAYAASRLTYGPDKPAQYMAFEGGRDHLLFLNHIDMNIILVRRELALRTGGFDETLRRWVDHDFAIRLAQLTSPLLLPFIGCDYEHSMDRPDRITVKESSHWQWVVLSKGLVDWSLENVSLRVPGRVSIVIPTYEDHEMTIRAVDSVLRDSGLPDLEVVVVDNGSTEPHAMVLARHLSLREGVRYLRLPKNYNFATGCNFGFLNSTGEYVLFLNNDTEMRSGTLLPLLGALEDTDVAGAQPLLLYPDDTIQCAGTVWAAPKSLPLHLLANHPAEDAEGVQGYRFSAVTAAALLMRASDFHELRGFDPFYVNGMEDVDLCLRALKIRRSGFRVVTESVITHHESKTPGRGKELGANRQIFIERWRGDLPRPDTEVLNRCGFEVVRIGSDGSKATVPGTKVILSRLPGGPRRWAIKNPANANRRGDGWGDTHFAASLATSLRNRGQQVVTFRHEGHGSETTSFDDVSLVLRGLDRVRPMPGQVNVLWIISHPDSVTAEELRSFDLVYAASEKWARWASKEYGVQVRPLLQATDAARFSFSATSENPSTDLVFVGGNHRGRERRVVAEALRSGVRFKVYGPGWNQLPDGYLAGSYVPNTELATVYRDAHFVLADHWDDMAQQGFIQNRLFDAVASGCRVITDDVDGLSEVFGQEVLVYRDADDLREALSPASLSDWGLEDRRRASDRVVRNHSFDARAQTLITDVEALLSAIEG